MYEKLKVQIYDLQIWPQNNFLLGIFTLKLITYSHWNSITINVFLGTYNESNAHGTRIQSKLLHNVFSSLHLSKSLPIDDKDVCCGFLDIFDDEVTFFTLAAAASL